MVLNKEKKMSRVVGAKEREKDHGSFKCTELENDRIMSWKNLKALLVQLLRRIDKWLS